MKQFLLMSAIFSTALSQGAVLTEVSFRVQGNDLTWFSLASPGVQGSIALSGLPNGFDSNALAYDSTNNRLLFTNGNPLQNPGIFAVELGGLILSPGLSVPATATSVGNFSFGSPQQVLGGEFYNGFYYALRDGSDTLLRIGFDGLGNVSSQTAINLPGDRTMNLGDLAFDANGNLTISGYNDAGSTAADDRLWRYSTADGLSFTELSAPINPAGDRFNGVGYNVAGDTFYGYRTDTGQFGTIDPVTGQFIATYTGPFFNGPGDLSSSALVLVVPEASSSLMLLGGAGLFLGIRRRR